MTDTLHSPRLIKRIIALTSVSLIPNHTGDYYCYYVPRKYSFHIVLALTVKQIAVLQSLSIARNFNLVCVGCGASNILIFLQPDQLLSFTTQLKRFCLFSKGRMACARFASILPPDPRGYKAANRGSFSAEPLAWTIDFRFRRWQDPAAKGGGADFFGR